MFLEGPGLHYAYDFFEWLIPARECSLCAGVQVALDTFTLDPLWVAVFFLVTGALEGREISREVLPDLRAEFWPAVKASWGVSAVLFPIQLYSFRFMPLCYRVLVVNLIDVFWTFTMSYASHRRALRRRRLAAGAKSD